jgi:hypothetical protein
LYRVGYVRRWLQKGCWQKGVRKGEARQKALGVKTKEALRHLIHQSIRLNHRLRPDKTHPLKSLWSHGADPPDVVQKPSTRVGIVPILKGIFLIG